MHCSQQTSASPEALNLALICRQQANQKAHQEYLDTVRRKEHEREAERKADEARKMRDEV